MSLTPAERVRKLIKESATCVISTASPSGKPESAAMLFSDDDKGNLYIYTFNDSRKYSNIIKNPLASIIIHEGDGYVQMDGKITELSDDEMFRAKKSLIEKHGESEFLSDSRSRYFIFKPTWIRIQVKTDYPPEYIVVKE